jgi:hypothetical protein
MVLLTFRSIPNEFFCRLREFLVQEQMSLIWDVVSPFVRALASEGWTLDSRSVAGSTRGDAERL